MPRRDRSRTGIQEVTYDEAQPFRVWFEGNILSFCKTREEAEKKLKEAKMLKRKER